MAAPQSFGRDVVTPQQAVELGTDEYAALRDGMARRLNCEGAAVYGCNEAGVVVRMWKQRSHAYAMERAAQEAIVTAPFVRCGAPLEARRQARRAARGGASAPRRLGSGTPRLPCAVCSVAAGPAPPMDHACKNSSRSVSPADAHVRSQVMHYEPSGDDAVVRVVPQGCGKSTFSRTLYALLRPGTAFAMLDQPRRGRRKAAVSWRHSARAARWPHAPYHRQDNLDEAARDDYADLGLRALTVVWSHPDGTDALVESASTESVAGFCPPHFKADRGEGRRVRQTLLDCATRCRPHRGAAD
ncbi:hypothetical protein TcBrA4_0139280 [Trypanosoma cruzi]|nr:hypothetical protein TcBrA4_0139280 [Trypanosoma cruzi]